MFVDGLVRRTVHRILNFVSIESIGKKSWLGVLGTNAKDTGCLENIARFIYLRSFFSFQ